MEERLLHWLARDGTIVLFFAQVLGIFGLPIPDEFLLTVAGTLVRKGHLHLWSTLLAALTGAMSGITLSYFLGRTVGLAVVHRFVHASDSTLGRAQRWFGRFGGWLLMFGYFIPGVRHVTAIVAGSTPVGFRTFAAYAYPGALIWSFGFVFLGYFAGERWRVVYETLRQRLPIVAAIILIIIACAVYLVASNQPPGARKLPE
jgi:membrane protein DedA with SNARE-associated domain